ncbi:MAG: MFS transporter [Hyphomicrobiaceae bacterium]
MNDGRPRPPPEGAPRYATLAAFNIALITLVGSSTLALSLAVLAPMMMATAGMPPAAFGWVSGAAGLGSVWLYMANSAFTVPLGPIKALMAATLIACAGAGLVMTGAYILMIPGAILIGFAYATTTPAGSQILADNTPPEKRNRIFSLRQTGVPLGGVIAGVAGSALAAHYGWRSALAVFVILLLAASSVLLRAPRQFNESRPRTQFRLARLFALSNLRQPFLTLATIPGLRLIALGSIGFAAVQGVLNAFFVTFLANGLGYDLKLAGLLFALNQALSVAGRVVYGFVADALGSPRPVLCALSALSAASGLAIASVGSGWSITALVAVAAFSGLSVATWNGLFMAEVAGLAPERASEATAGATFFVFATYVVTPPVAGIVITWLGYRAAFAMAAVCVAIAGLVLAGGWRGRMRG